MALEPGAQLGRYRIAGLVGAGGMGEVYRARDLRLGREVALKVLPAWCAGDPERLQRFEQEARATGALNHPNIVAVHDIGSEGGTTFVVCELLEGETLRERLAAGPLSPRKAAELGIQIARGLAAAHGKGIVHRDLKPENLFVTRGGHLKILDFGLAKLLRPGPEDPLAAEAPTLATTTQPGTILGTVGYMAPEQVSGLAVDHRADLFALGAILHEMVTGERAFKGSTPVEVMSAILKEEPPDLATFRPQTPLALQRIVRHCLEKRHEERFQSAGDVAFALEELSVPSYTGSHPLAAAAPAPRRRLRALAVAGVPLLLAAGAFLLGRATSSRPEPVFRQLTFRRGSVAAARFAPDGRTVYYSAVWQGKPQEVFAVVPGTPESRPLGLTPARLVAASATELGVVLLRGFSGGGTLARAPLGAGAPRELAEDVMEADWSADGTAVAAVREVGEREQLEYPLGTVLYETAAWMAYPRISPDGELLAIIDHPVSGDSRGAVVVVDRKGARRTLSPGWNEAFGLAWAPDGRSLYFTAASVGNAQGLYRVTLSGRQRMVTRVAGRLTMCDIGRGGRALVTHPTSRWELLGQPPGETRERDLSWLDQSVAADLSSDGSLLLFGESGDGGGERYSVYLRRTDGSPPVRLGDGQATALSPDGAWAASIVHGEPSRLVLLPTGAGTAATLPRGSIAEYHWAWFLPDGRRLLVEANEAGKQRRLWVQQLPDGEPRVVTPEGTSAPRANAIPPGGSAVVASCTDDPARYCLYPLAGGAQRPIAGLKAREEPLRFSADGAQLFVREVSRMPVRIARLDVRSGERVPWREIAPADPTGVRIRQVLLTPDGAGYVYHYQRSLSDLFLLEGL